MHVLLVLTWAAAVLKTVPAAELQLMQVHATLVEEGFRTSHLHTTKNCEGVDCDISRNKSGLAFAQIGAITEAAKGRYPYVQGPVHMTPTDDQNYVVWTLCDATFHSNLGGQGPDSGEASIRYLQVATAQDENGVERNLDLVIEATSPYTAQSIDFNGLVRQDGEPTCFGQVNVKSDTHVDLTFSWFLAGTRTPVTPNLQYFTIYDLDGTSQATEAITFYSEVNQLYHSDRQVLTRSGNLQNSGGLTYSADGLSNNVELPRDPDVLTEEQKERAVTVEFDNVQQYKLTFRVTGGKGGRNFAFSGNAEPLAPVRKYRPTAAPTTAPTLSPTPAPTDVLPPRSPPPPQQDQQACVGEDCIIWGDPHIITFQHTKEHRQLYGEREMYYRTHEWKNDQISVHEHGTFWLVKNDRIQIQGRYESNSSTTMNATSLAGLAIGGSFLGGNLLVIRTGLENCTWNDENILQDMPSEFRNDVIHARYNQLIPRVTTGKIGIGMEVRLPEGMVLTVNRWKHSLDAKISVCRAVAMSTSGQCGRVIPKRRAQQMLAVPSHEDWITSRVNRQLKPREIIFPDGRPLEKITAKFAHTTAKSGNKTWAQRRSDQWATRWPKLQAQQAWRANRAQKAQAQQEAQELQQELSDAQEEQTLEPQEVQDEEAVAEPQDQEAEGNHFHVPGLSWVFR